MNGVRRLLGGGPSSSSLTSSPPSQPQQHVLSSPATTSSSLKTPPPRRSNTMPNSPTSASTSSRHSTSRNHQDSPYKRSSAPLNTRDELLMSLMASEAVIDCREFDILSAEEVEDLKKEHQLLSSRLAALTKKLALETKIRDAAVSLSKVKKSSSPSSTEQLEVANKRVEKAQHDLWKLSDRFNAINTRLMEHRAGVLSFSVRNMEMKLSPQMSSEDSGYDSSNRSTLMSPTTPSTSATSVSVSSKSRFDGAHLFAGHAETVVPRRKLSPEAAAAEVAALEDKLKAAKEALAAAGQKQAEMSRELSMLRLEKQEVETVLGMDLQAARETITALEGDLPHFDELDLEVKGLREEKGSWEQEREELVKRNRIVEARLMDVETKNGSTAGETERLLHDYQRQLDDKEDEVARIRDDWEAEREDWERERANLEDEKLDDLAHLQLEMDKQQEERDQALQQVNDELNLGLSTLQAFVKTHSIVLFARDSSLQGLLNAVGIHIESVHTKLEGYAKAEAEWENMKRNLEDEIQASLDKQATLTRELEETRRERDILKQQPLNVASRAITPQTQTHTRSPSTNYTALPSEEGDSNELQRFISILQPLWAILPSPEARAAKFGQNRTFRTGSPTPSISSGTSSTNAGTASSLSDLDVRSLKALYDTMRQPGTPNSPGHQPNGPFTIDAFASRVQALVNDDRALIARLLRFAQAHDMLKKNAERAQKLAQDGNTALETYQRQVRILEEKNLSSNAKASAMQEELQLLHDAIERLTADKRELENRAVELAEQSIQLKDANNTLSANALKLAEEAAQAPEMIRKQLEGQLNECKKALALAQDEVDALRSSEQSQRIALLDELNSMQTENGTLRAQLRAANARK